MSHHDFGAGDAMMISRRILKVGFLLALVFTFKIAFYEHTLNGPEAEDPVAFKFRKRFVAITCILT